MKKYVTVTIEIDDLYTETIARIADKSVDEVTYIDIAFVAQLAMNRILQEAANRKRFEEES